MIHIKRVYEPAAKGDGYRILVDRLWPRGLKKADASIDEWAKEVAPTAALRKWAHQEGTDWDLFKEKYNKELLQNTAVDQLVKQIKTHKTVTLLYASHNKEQNHAIVLLDFLKSKV